RRRTAGRVLRHARRHGPGAARRALPVRAPPRRAPCHLDAAPRRAHGDGPGRGRRGARRLGRGRGTLAARDGDAPESGTVLLRRGFPRRPRRVARVGPVPRVEPGQESVAARDAVRRAGRPEGAAVPAFLSYAIAAITGVATAWFNLRSDLPFAVMAQALI